MGEKQFEEMKRGMTVEDVEERFRRPGRHGFTRNLVYSTFTKKWSVSYSYKDYKNFGKKTACKILNENSGLAQVCNYPNRMVNISKASRNVCMKGFKTVLNSVDNASRHES